MEKTIKVDNDKRMATVIIQDIPLWAIKNLPAMAQDITDEIINLYYLQKEGNYRQQSITLEAFQENRDRSEASA